MRATRPLILLDETSISIACLPRPRRFELAQAGLMTLNRDLLEIDPGRGHVVFRVRVSGLSDATFERLAHALRMHGGSVCASRALRSLRVRRGVRDGLVTLLAAFSIVLGVRGLEERTPGSAGRLAVADGPRRAGALDREAVSALPLAQRDCLASPAAERYLGRLHTRLEANWDATTKNPEVGFVSLGFMLERSGALRFSRVLERSSGAYERIGRRVLAQSAPFAALTGELRCLEGIELRARLENQEAR